MKKRKYTHCVCGCGKPLTGNKQLYFTTKCRAQHKFNSLLNGCLSINEIVFGICPVCERDFISWKDSVRKTCRWFRNSECHVVSPSMQKKMNGNQYGKYKNKQYAQKKNERGEHVATYCHQEDDECEDYSECMGNCYTGSCFKKPIKKFFGINASSFSGSYYLKF